MQAPSTSAASQLQTALRLRSATQPPEVEKKSAAGDSIVFNFTAAPWDVVLKRFASEAGLGLHLEVLPPGTLTYVDSRSYSVTEALDILNGFLMERGFLLLRRNRILSVVRTDQAISPHLVPHIRAEDLDNYGQNELLSIVVTVANIDAATAAREVQGLLGPMGKVIPFVNADRLVITDIGANLRRIHELLRLNEIELARRPYRVYKLKNTPVVEVAGALGYFLGAPVSRAPGPAFSGGPGAPPPEGGRPATRPPALPAAGGGGDLGILVVPEVHTNSLLVSCPPKYTKMIDSLICRLDAPPHEVVIQALLVEVELGNTDEFGVELGAQDSVLFDRSVINNILTVTESVSNPGTGVVVTNDRIISQEAVPGFPFNNVPLGNNVAVSPRTVGSQGLSNFSLGRVNNDLGYGGLVLSASSQSISVLLRALAATRRVNILSRPQIRTIHNQPAKIQVGQQVPVVDGVQLNALGNANPVIRQDDAGIILEVTPRICPDGSVTIDVKAEKSAFRTGPGSGVPIFTDATNGNVIEAPIKDITTATTMVTVKSEQTIVLGGMITKDTVSVDNRVPFLGDLPVFGYLFRHSLDQVQRRELLIFLTPHVLRSDLHSDLLRELETLRTAFPRRDACQMHNRVFCQPPNAGPWPVGPVVGEPGPTLPVPNVPPPAEKVQGVPAPGAPLPPQSLPRQSPPPQSPPEPSVLKHPASNRSYQPRTGPALPQVQQRNSSPVRRDPPPVLARVQPPPRAVPKPSHVESTRQREPLVGRMYRFRSSSPPHRHAGESAGAPTQRETHETMPVLVPPPAPEP